MTVAFSATGGWVYTFYWFVFKKISTTQLDIIWKSAMLYSKNIFAQVCNFKAEEYKLCLFSSLFQYFWIGKF